LDAPNIPPNGTRTYAAAILLEDFVVAVDALQFSTQKIGSKYSLTYKLGKFGQPMGGAFHLYSVAGKDTLDIAGNPSDAWAATFLLMPRQGVDSGAGFTPFDSVTVHIGTGFNQVIPSTSFATSRNGAIQLSIPGNGAAVKSLTINPQSFTGTLMTNPLSTTLTGLPLSTGTVGNQNLFFFDLGIDINRSGGNASFMGEDGKFILPNNLFTGTWIDRLGRKFGVVNVKQ
jgi:hypothetical protein